MVIPYKLLGYAGGALLVALLIGSYGSSRYRAGQAERTVHYEKILAAIDAKGKAQEAHAREKERAIEAIETEREQAYVTTEKRLRERADAAERSYTRILQELADQHAEHLPEAGPGPEAPRGAPGVPERFGLLAAQFRAIGERAVRDAERLHECQQFLRDERAILAVSE